MSWKRNLKKYINLLDNFINGELTASEFDWIFSHLWMEDRDEEYENESERFKELLELLKMKKISSNEYSKEFSKEYYATTTSEIRKLTSILGRIFTSCDVFNDDDDRAYYELNAVELKEEVIKLREELVMIKEEEL